MDQENKLTQLFDDLHELQNAQEDICDKIGSILDNLYSAGVTPDKKDYLYRFSVGNHQVLTKSKITDYLVALINFSNYDNDSEPVKRLYKLISHQFMDCNSGSLLTFTEIIDRLSKLTYPDDLDTRVNLHDWYEGESIIIEVKVGDEWQEVVNFTIVDHYSRICSESAKELAKAINSKYISTP